MADKATELRNEQVRRARAAAFDARAGAGKYGPPLPPKMADSAGATGGPSFSQNPYARSNDNAQPAAKPVITNMRQGMGNTNPATAYNRSNQSDLASASKDLRGYAYDLIRKGKSFDEARKLMTGLEQFRGLSQGGQDYVLGEFDSWAANQSSQRAKNVRNIVGDIKKPGMSQAPDRRQDLIKSYQDEASNYGF